LAYEYLDEVLGTFRSNILVSLLILAKGTSIETNCKKNRFLKVTLQDQVSAGIGPMYMK